MIDPRLHRVGRFVGAGVVGLAIVIAVVLAVPQAIGAEASYVVLSDSMTPTFGSGDIVVVRSVSPSAVSPGDVITFEHPRPEAGQSNRTTHRVVAVNSSGGTYMYRTKGDANENVDPLAIDESSLIGQLWFSIPYVGYMVMFAQSRLGILVLIIVPGLLLIVTELYSLIQDGTISEGDSGEGEQ